MTALSEGTMLCYAMLCYANKLAAIHCFSKIFS